MNEKRIVFLISVIFVLGVLLIVRLVQLQLIHGEEHRNTAENIRLKKTLIRGQRGSIVDRNGVELAREDAVWELRMNYWIFIEPENILQRLYYVGEKNSGFTENEFKELSKILIEISEYRKNRSINRRNRFFDTWEKRQHRLILKEINFTLARLANLLVVDVSLLKSKIEHLLEEINSVFYESSNRITEKYSKLVKLGSSSGYWNDLARAERREQKQIEKRKYQDNPLILVSEIDSDILETILELEWLFPGISGVPKLNRKYPLGSVASHLIGYLREIERIGFNIEEGKDFKLTDSPHFNKEMQFAVNNVGESFIFRHFRDEREFREKSKRVIFKIPVGVTGSEKFFNDRLRGKYGYAVIEKDVRERSKKVLDDVPPEASKPLKLTIDSRLQRAAEESLRWYFENGNPEGCAGAAVVMNVYTGEILILASFPNYDLNKLMGQTKEDKEYRKKLFSNEVTGKPLFNRALHATVPPGSVFKILTSIAAVQEVVLDGPEFWDEKEFTTKWDVAKRYRASGFTDHHSWGKLYLAKAIEVSCNPFFHEQAHNVGYNKMWNWANIFGFGEKTGAKLAEFNPWRKKRNGEFYNWLYPLAPCSKLESALNGIGQGKLLVTPLQVCRFMCAVATKGNLPTPVILHEDIGAAQIKHIEVEEAGWDSIHTGMKNVVFGRYGTARRNKLLKKYKVAGKTGTAQTGRKKNGKELNFGWFAGFAPYDNPVIAFAVYIEDTFDSGANSAGKVAGEILKSIAENSEYSEIFEK